MSLKVVLGFRTSSNSFTEQQLTVLSPFHHQGNARYQAQRSLLSEELLALAATAQDYTDDSDDSDSECYSDEECETSSNDCNNNNNTPTQPQHQPESSAHSDKHTRLKRQRSDPVAIKCSEADAYRRAKDAEQRREALRAREALLQQQFLALQRAQQANLNAQAPQQ